MNKPVILLAFANETPDDRKYLRNLRFELNQLRQILKIAEDKGLCSLEILTNTTVDNLFDAFLDPKYWDRIAILHFAGHASSFELLLEESKGSTKSAHSDGLVPFLTMQKSLQLVYLNGCHSAPFGQKLIQHGIPVVIGTVQEIEDQVASDLAIQFYKGLADGIGIDYAWNTSISKVKTQLGTRSLEGYYHKSLVSTRGLVQEGKRNQFPWEIYYKKGKEIVKNWNLPDTVNDPYFGLPEPEDNINLPDEPYRFLSRYQRTDHPIFFGRGQEIRSLYMKLTSKHSSPVIFLFGQSGVGKSSLLDAGLLPRIEVEYEMVYLRRDKEIGLLGQLSQELDGADYEYKLPVIDQLYTEKPFVEDLEALEKALEKLKPNARAQLQIFINEISSKKEIVVKNTVPVYADLRGKWLKREAKSDKKGLIIVLDQVEEVFTQPNINLPNEVEDLFHQVSLIFNTPTNRPQGKLLISYRKEFDPEITTAAKKNTVPYEKVYLNRLDKKGILEVINGLISTEQLRNKYSLKIEMGLPIVIANYLLMDKKSPIGPVLQIILTKLWKSEQENPNPVFTHTVYGNLLEDGVLLSDFFEQQMIAIREWEKTIGQEIESNGLALDILENHTTDYGTSEDLSIEKLRSLYQHRSDILQQLIDQFQKLHLLTQSSKNQTRLAHDTLAPIIKKAVKDSNRPGQIAMKILEGKMADYGIDPKNTVIEKSSLKLVEKGEGGMRIWYPKERALVEKSRRQRSKNERIRLAAIIFGVLLIGTGLLAYFQQLSIIENNKINEMISRANFVWNEGKPKDALAIVREALDIRPEDRSLLGLQHAIYSENEFYTKSVKLDHRIEKFKLLPDRSQLLTTKDSSILLYDLSGKLIRNYRYKQLVSALVYNENSGQVIGGYANGDLVVWNLNGEKQVLPNRLINNRINGIASNEVGDFMIVIAGNGTYLLNPENGKLNEFTEQEALIETIALSKDGKEIILGLANHNAIYQNLRTKEQRVLNGHKDRVLAVAFEPSGELMATASRDQSIRLWNKQGELVTILNGHDRRVNDVTFSPDGRFLLSASDDHSIVLWDVENQRFIKRYLAHQNYITGVEFVSNSEFISGGLDSMIYVWSKDSKVIQTFGSFSDGISSVSFNPVGQSVFITVGNLHSPNVDGEWGPDRITEWDLETGQLINQITGYTGAINELISLREMNGIFGTVGDDGRVILWDESNLDSTILSRHNGPAYTIDYSPELNLGVTGGEDGNIFLWDTKGELKDTLGTHISRVSSVAFAPNGKYVFSSGYDRRIKIWSMDGELLNSIEGHTTRILDLAISPNGKYLLTAGWDNIAKLWSIKQTNLEPIASFTINQGNFAGAKTMNCVTFSPDNQFFAIGSEGGVAQVYNVEGQVLQAVSDGGRKGIYALSFSPDSHYLLVGYSDGWGRLYENISKRSLKVYHQ